MADTRETDQPGPGALDAALLAILACPACRQKVQARGDVLQCTQCGRRYPVRDGIPVMLLDEALPPDQNAQA
jgi:uncharacterized protein YbaR (Trm112 family)